MALAEYSLGIVLPAALGLWSLVVGLSQQVDLCSWPVLGGVWLVMIAANYVPLFLHALALARAGTVQEVARPAEHRGTIRRGRKGTC
jgi:hypothetical protein